MEKIMERRKSSSSSLEPFLVKEGDELGEWGCELT
jgi:hypothetical protein